MMQIDIQARSFPLTDALYVHIKRRLGFALSAGVDHIQRVKARLTDINGPRGGVDKRCHIQIVLAHLPDVVIENTEADLYAAIDRAADRAGRTVRRRLARQRVKDRSLRQPYMKSISESYEPM
jgi:ribosome-associated translation inhibitor RaiA